MFGTIDTLLGESQKKAYLESKECWFYELVFKRIDEKAFTPLCEATLFNFQNRLLEYEVVTGIHLIEQVFDGLTADTFLRRLRPSIRRMKSNIRTAIMVAKRTTRRWEFWGSSRDK